MKISDVLKSASTNLMRNKGRTILTIVAIFIGAFTIAITTGINNGVNDYIDKQIGSVGGENQLFVQPKQGEGMPGSDEPQEYKEDKQENEEMKFLTNKNLEKMKEINEIKEAEPFRFLGTDYIQGNTKKKYVFSAASPSDLTLDLEAGRQVDAKADRYEVNLAQEFVKALGYSSAKDALNKKVKVAISSQATQEQKIVEAVIVGVRNTSLVQGGQSIVNHTLANKIIEINEQGLPENMKNRFTMVSVTMKSDLSKDVIKKVQDKLDKQGLMSQTVDDEIGMIRNVINAITGVLTMFGAIALLAASFGIINTLYMSVQERTREIGLMKAMGLSSFKVFIMFSFEAMMIGLLGSVIGILGAMAAGNLINGIAADSFLQALTGFTLLQFNPVSSGIIVAIIMGIAFLAGTLPASRAAKLDPITSLRYE